MNLINCPDTERIIIGVKANILPGFYQALDDIFNYLRINHIYPAR
jgi:hypothetical protein